MLSTLSHDDGSKEGWYLGIIFFETISSVCGTRKKKKKKRNLGILKQVIKNKTKGIIFLMLEPHLEDQLLV